MSLIFYNYANMDVILIPEKVLEFLQYNKESGKLFWKKRKGPKANVGDPAGTQGGDGYRVIVFDRKVYREHRVIWFLMTKEQPEQIDHINGNRYDNRWINLRNVNQSINMNNTYKHRDVSSSSTGVSWDKTKNKWRARNPVCKCRFIGLFKTKKEAVVAVKDMILLHKHLAKMPVP